MPHYHNFGWYYFAKYVLGLAGMIFLYTGFLKEKSVVCVCPAEERELERGKKRNNESSPTGDPTDAPARTNLNAQTSVAVDAKIVNAQAPIPITRALKNHQRIAVTREEKLRPKYPSNRHLHRGKLTSFSSFDGNVEIRDCEKCHTHCFRRGVKQRRDGNNRKFQHRGTSSHSSKSKACLELENKRNNRRSILDAVARANLQVKNSFAEQENLELEAFVRSIVDDEITTKLGYSRCEISTSASYSSSEISRNTKIEDTEDEACQSSSSENDNFQKYRSTRRRVPVRMCKKHYPQTPATSSLTSVRSRSGTLYFTASSRGKKRHECKIHGRRFFNGIQNASDKNFPCSRRREESQKSNREIKDFRSSTNRRRIGGQQITRYTSTMIFTL